MLAEEPMLGLITADGCWGLGVCAGGEKIGDETEGCWYEAGWAQILGCCCGCEALSEAEAVGLFSRLKSSCRSAMLDSE